MMLLKWKVRCASKQAHEKPAKSVPQVKEPLAEPSPMGADACVNAAICRDLDELPGCDEEQALCAFVPSLRVVLDVCIVPRHV